MPKNQDSLNNELFNLLQSRGYNPVMLNTDGKEIPVPEEADVFQFHFEKDGVDYGTATVSIDGLHKLVVYFGDKIASSPKLDTNDSESWYHLLRQIRRFAQKHQLSFETRNIDKLEYDMAKREHTKKLDEGYYPAGKKASISDSTPTVKMRIQHTREIQEGEQRFRNIARIFIENAEGERFLLPTNKPGLARVFARHIAEGGTPYDDRGQHISKIVEEYQHMAGFVRATRNGQFNESAQRLVNEGINHYQKLRESLHRMAGKRGYNEYFENWSAPLMEDEEQVDLSEMFMSSSLDPRIESVMPILSKLSKNITETTDIAEVKELEEWADSVTEGDLAEDDGFNVVSNYQDMRSTEKGGKSNQTYTGTTIQKNPITGQQKSLASWDHTDPVTGKNYSGTNYIDAEGNAEVDKNYEESIDPVDEGKKDRDDGLIGGRYTQSEWDQMVNRLKQLAHKQEAEKKAKQAQPKPEEKTDESISGPQQAAGQLDATSKVTVGGKILGEPLKSQKGLRGKLVGGTTESVELSEMDSPGPYDDPWEKGGKGKPITANKVKKDFAKVLQKSMDKAHKAKQDTDKKVKQHQVKEGQEDLDAILRIVKK